MPALADPLSRQNFGPPKCELVIPMIGGGYLPTCPQCDGHEMTRLTPLPNDTYACSCGYKGEPA
jgi:hypothetical protein